MVEHNEISQHVQDIGEQVGLKKAATLLEKTLKVEEATDDALTQVAEAFVNKKQKAAE